MNIGERVKILREKKGMTQEELATLLGYKSKSSVTHIENGRDIPRSMVVRLAAILEVTPSYLMGWDEQTENAPGSNTKSVDELFESKMTETKWTTILNELSQENRDRLQEQAELLLLKQQVQADKEGK